MRKRSSFTLPLATVALIAAGTFAPIFGADAPPKDFVPQWPQDARARHTEMKRRIDAWLAKGEALAMPMHLVYLSCEDQEPFPKHRQRLDRVLTEIQDWFATQNEAMGFGRTTLNLVREDDGKVKLLTGKLPFTVKSRVKENKFVTHRECVKAARALVAAQGADYNKSFVLILTTIPDDLGAAPFFGNIIQDRGYCFAVDATWMDTNYTTIDGPKVWKNKPVGTANSALIGGIAHELGHGLGLPHADEVPAMRQTGESLMGSGNYTWRQERRGKKRATFLLDGDAAFLAARPPFTGRVRDFDKQPKAWIEGLRLARNDDGTITVTGQARSDVPAYAVRLYDDPPGNSDYNAATYMTLPDEKTGAFRLSFRPLKQEGEHAIRIYLYHVNGRWTRVASSMAVDKQGNASLDRINGELLALPSPHLVEGDRCPLGKSQAASTKVHWGRMMVGRTPTGPIRIGGKPSPSGMFAHAPSRLTYQLDGRWKKLSTRVGLQDGTAKAATFRVVGDGKELAVANITKTGETKTLEIDVSGVKRLELIAEPPASGARSCWTIWGEPTLTR